MTHVHVSKCQCSLSKTSMPTTHTRQMTFVAHMSTPYALHSCWMPGLARKVCYVERLSYNFRTYPLFNTLFVDKCSQTALCEIYNFLLGVCASSFTPRSEYHAIVHASCSKFLQRSLFSILEPTPVSSVFLASGDQVCAGYLWDIFYI